MREELVTEPDALARALDQPGDVGDDELAAVRRLDGAEHRRERRERIVGDLRPRVREARDERRLAGVRQPDERCVGEQLQAQLDRALLARASRPRRSAASAASESRSACCRGRRRRPSRRRRARPGCARSATSRSSSSSTCVPTGTCSTASSPSRAVRQPPAAGAAPAGAQLLVRAERRRGRAAADRRRARRRRRRPPSPPSGPPRGTNFSRRKWIEPSPPRPACTVSLARS